MTDDQMQSIRDDIAYMTALAREGEGAPMQGGPILAAAGAVFGGASLAQWALFTGRLPGGNAVSGWVWMVAMLAFFAVLFSCKAGKAGRPGSHTAVNRAGRAVWMGAGFALFAVAVAISAAAVRTQQWLFWGLFPSVVLAFYGAAWAAGAAMTRKLWLWTVALGCFLGTAGLAFLIGTAELYLAYAGCLFLFALLPGLALMRAEPRKVA